jgi:hypothetical protein
MNFSGIMAALQLERDQIDQEIQAWSGRQVPVRRDITARKRWPESRPRKVWAANAPKRRASYLVAGAAETVTGGE